MRSTRKVKVLVVGIAAMAIAGFGIATTMPANAEENAPPLSFFGVSYLSMSEAVASGIYQCQSAGAAGGTAVSGGRTYFGDSQTEGYQVKVECTAVSSS